MQAAARALALSRQLRCALLARPCRHFVAQALLRQRSLATAAAAPLAPPTPPLPLPPQLSPEGVPLLPGEVLLHTAGSATASVVRQSWLPTAICSAYLALVKGVELSTPHLDALLNFQWTCAFLAMTLGSTLLAMGTTGVCVRALALTADGQALRVFPYGSLPLRFMGIGLGPSVTIPLQLLRENADFAGAKRDADSLFIQVRSGGLQGKWAHAHLIVDKPPPAVVPRLPAPGSGLAFTQRGLAPASAASLAAAPAAAAAAAAAAAGGSAAPPPPVLLPPLASAADRAALRRYVLLVWLLQGNCVVDMARLHAGDWRPESIAADLGEAGLGSSSAGRAYQARALAGLWVEARVAEGEHAGRVYYYNKLTWERAWQLPFKQVVDKQGL
jgi:hypothetical protein